MGITRREVITKAMGFDGWSAEELDVWKKMLDSLEKKSSKPTKTQVENEKIKADILALLADGETRTATEIGVELIISCQKASALLKQLVEKGDVVKIVGRTSKEPTRFTVVE